MRSMAASRRVLVVDDNDDIRFLLRLNLEDFFEIFEASSTTEALDRIAAGEQFDLVITDVVQPGMNGIEFTERLHSDLPDLPVVVLSAWVTKKNAQVALDAGACAALSKPFPPGELVPTITRLLAKTA